MLKALERPASRTDTLSSDQQQALTCQLKLFISVEGVTALEQDKPKVPTIMLLQLFCLRVLVQRDSKHIMTEQ